MVPGVLDQPEVKAVRTKLIDVFDAGVQHRGDVQLTGGVEGRGGGVRHHVLERLPLLRDVVLRPPVVEALRSLLGDDFVFLPETAIHDSRYGHWHKDTTPMERAGVTWHWAPDFEMVTCAIYFQDNDEFGGGLDIVPGSHTEPDSTPPAPKVTFLNRVGNKLGVRALTPKPTAPPAEPRGITLPSRAGDLVMFKYHTKHQATQPRSCSVSELPRDKRKIALFFSCSANNEHAVRYVEFVRGQYRHLSDGHRYSPELLELAAQRGASLID
jgi:hypothetical protein